MRDRPVFPAVSNGWYDKHRQTTLVLDGSLCFQLEDSLSTDAPSPKKILRLGGVCRQATWVAVVESKREVAAVTFFGGERKEFEWRIFGEFPL